MQKHWRWIFVFLFFPPWKHFNLTSALSWALTVCPQMWKHFNLPYLILMATLWSRYYYYHFTDEKTEARDRYTQGCAVRVVLGGFFYYFSLQNPKIDQGGCECSQQRKGEGCPFGSWGYSMFLAVPWNPHAPSFSHFRFCINFNLFKTLKH